MKKIIRKLIKRTNRKHLVRIFLMTRRLTNLFIDVVAVPLIFIAGILLKMMRNNRFQEFKASEKILYKIGIYPIRNHYYDPFVDYSSLRHSLREPRKLSSIDFNDKEQLELLSQFQYMEELLNFPLEKSSDNVEFAYNYGQFRAGDAEYLYNVVRHYKPQKIIEIGCGQSTLMMLNAIKKNKSEDQGYDCSLTCIEPYENQWLENLEINLIRKRVENLDDNIFSSLSLNDILFIDSSHVIKPQGDVLFEYLELLPMLNPGVIVHVHDIFTPRDYPDNWIKRQYLWNEQYLLEAFLSYNRKFRVIGAVNYLMHSYQEKLFEKCPVLKISNEDLGQGLEPGSFWLIKN